MGLTPWAFHLCGVPVPYGCGCQACEVHTLAGSPLGRAWRYPRVAQRCNSVARCPNYELGPRWLLRIASGVLWVSLGGDPRVGLPGMCLAPACAVWW